ncbi:MAG: EFR1 family ferrodoxin [Lachnospiraceae bacterium]|nr:EFR1 family ferrodoxin [Lachnospiraceae bacterium]
MKYKKVWAMYFSPTGTTKKIVTNIAKEVAHGIEAELSTLDFTPPMVRNEGNSFSENDIVIFGVPVYAGRVPNVLLEYLSKVIGGGAIAVPVVLFGNRNYDDALIELRNILHNNGFSPVAAGAFIGEHSFSRILGKNRPDERDLKVATEFASEIANKIITGNFGNIPVEVKGENSLRGYYKPRDMKENIIDIRKVKPKTNDKCNNCGICVKVCPMGSISSENVREYTGICIKCGACIKKCPQNAKYYDDENYLYHKKDLEEEFQRRAEPETFL